MLKTLFIEKELRNELKSLIKELNLNVKWYSFEFNKLSNSDVTKLLKHPTTSIKFIRNWSFTDSSFNDIISSHELSEEFILFVLNKYKDYSYEPLSKISRNPYLTEEIAFKYFHEIGIDSILKTKHLTNEIKLKLIDNFGFGNNLYYYKFQNFGIKLTKDFLKKHIDKLDLFKYLDDAEYLTDAEYYELRILDPNFENTQKAITLFKKMCENASLLDDFKITENKFHSITSNSLTLILSGKDLSLVDSVCEYKITIKEYLALKEIFYLNNYRITNKVVEDKLNEFK